MIVLTKMFLRSQMFKGNFQNFRYVKTIPQTKFFKPILKPKIVNFSPESEEIAKEPSPERELKEVIDHSFGKKKELKRKKVHKNSLETEGGEKNAEVASIRSNQKPGETTTTTGKKAQSLPTKKRRKEQKSSIFDNY